MLAGHFLEGISLCNQTEAQQVCAACTEAFSGAYEEQFDDPWWCMRGTTEQIESPAPALLTKEAILAERTLAIDGSESDKGTEFPAGSSSQSGEKTRDLQR